MARKKDASVRRENNSSLSICNKETISGLYEEKGGVHGPALSAAFSAAMDLLGRKVNNKC